MCSLMISAVIYLMVKGDATDETFTRNIILGKKKLVHLPASRWLCCLFGTSQTSTESWTGAH